MSEPTVHALKTAPPYYDAVEAGMKTFDIRVADRKFKVGDNLVLCEYVNGRYTGAAVQRVITYVMSDPEYVLAGSVVLGIRPPNPDEKAIRVGDWLPPLVEQGVDKTAD